MQVLRQVLRGGGVCAGLPLNTSQHISEGQARLRAPTRVILLITGRLQMGGVVLQHALAGPT